MCAVCYEISGMENQHSDDDHGGELIDCATCRPELSWQALEELQRRAEK